MVSQDNPKKPKSLLRNAIDIIVWGNCPGCHLAFDGKNLYATGSVLPGGHVI